MGPLGRVNPYYKGVKEESSLFFTVVCVNVFSYHTDVIFSYFKASDQSFLLNGNLYLLKITVKHQFYNSSFIRFIHSFFLSFFFLLVLPWQVTASDAGRPVFSFGRTLTLMCPLYAVQGCHLYRSILSMMLTMLQSLQSFPLHHFLSPKLSFFHKVSFSIVPDKILPAICTIYMPLSLASSP